MSLGALNRRFNVVQIPVNWYGRTWGSSKLRLQEMGRRYLQTLVKAYAERVLISDDLMAERFARRRAHADSAVRSARRLEAIEARLEDVERRLVEDGRAERGGAAP
jgi:dolichol-phosphate mannosyltransferase